MIEFHLGEFVLSQKRFVLLKESQPEVFDKFWSGGGRVDPSALTLIYVLTASRHSDSR